MMMPPQQQQMMMMMPEDMIGAIKIKDGLFIGDEFSAQVPPPSLYIDCV